MIIRPAGPQDPEPLRAHASKAALPLFESMGFGVVREEVVERDGIPLLRYAVVLEDRSA